ncbi:hypothetical protein ABZ890_16870 [Streptomyces sp. NPDC046984]|uniref:hypothetical protein n=1 Tax=Streptomyces sp. NPDC046984 TaxID=3155138 RepID=UPI0033C02AC6
MPGEDPAVLDLTGHEGSHQLAVLLQRPAALQPGVPQGPDQLHLGAPLFPERGDVPIGSDGEATRRGLLFHDLVHARLETTTPQPSFSSCSPSCPIGPSAMLPVVRCDGRTT